ncbi:MAG: hypothetical protein U5R49_25325 [Deltaproteobacteria bacterium]|nr:hypothetical protein [Deltaproteobacteria bacterium]
MPHLLNNTLAPIDTSWFDADPEAYLTRLDFLEFQELAGIDLQDLLSTKRPVVEKAQQQIVSQSKVFSEIRREHSGYSPPFLYYTHDLEFAQGIPRHNMELDKKVLAMSQGDSLRRRHLALSYAILPSVITELTNKMNCPIRIKNLGSGVGLDVINAVRNVDGRVDYAWQYDINGAAIRLGETITNFLENENEIPRSVIRYSPESFLASREPADLVVMVGVICGLNDRAALTTLKLAHRILGGGGRIVVTSSNENMLDRDPLGSFIIQHIGSAHDPFHGWGLNCRSRETMYRLLEKAGFTQVQLFDDAEYPGRTALLKKGLLTSVDTLPSEVMGHGSPTVPLALPPPEERAIGFNHIAVAVKE